MGLHLLLWIEVVQSSVNGGDTIGSFDTGFTQDNQISPRFSDGNAYFRINDGATASGGITTATAKGHYLANRSGASAQQGYKNAVDQGVVAVASGGPFNGNIFTLASNRNGTAGFGSPVQLTMASIGGSMTSAQVTKFYNRLQTYMSAVGVS